MTATRRFRSPLLQAWVVLGVGAFAYFIAILHRMALGVAGTDAAERFGVGVGALGIFTSLQLVLYLVMQIPSGLLADRFGPRRTLAIGLGMMAAGQLLFAVSHSMAPALVGRGLVGIGDALTFLNVLRLAHAWFPSRMQPMLVALIGFAGAVGQLVSTVPLGASLGALHWVGTFILLGGLTAVLVLLPLTLVRDAPDAPPAGHASQSETGVAEHEGIGRTLVAAWRRPATRQGFFLHMGALAPFLLVSAVWGIPYMVGTQGMDRGTATEYLMAGAIAFTIGGPATAFLVGGKPRRLRLLSLALPGLTGAAWAVLLFWPSPAVPRGVLLIALVATGFSAGGSMLAFEIARRTAPSTASGSAAALVNCGGFSAAVIGSLAMGGLFEAGGGPGAVQHAMLPVFVVAAVGLIGCVLTRGAPDPRHRESGSLVPD